MTFFFFFYLTLHFSQGKTKILCCDRQSQRYKEKSRNETNCTNHCLLSGYTSYEINTTEVDRKTTMFSHRAGTRDGTPAVGPECVEGESSHPGGA